MRDELVTVLEALRRAQAELGFYLDSADRNAELTIAKLVGILDRRDVVGAARLLGAADISSSAAVPARNVSSRERVERSDAALAGIRQRPRIRTTTSRGGVWLHGVRYFGRGSLSRPPGSTHRPVRLASTASTKISAAFLTSAWKARSRSSASWLVAYGSK
jgi:hypothetical protein